MGKYLTYAEKEEIVRRLVAFIRLPISLSFEDMERLEKEASGALITPEDIMAFVLRKVP